MQSESQKGEHSSPTTWLLSQTNRKRHTFASPAGNKVTTTLLPNGEKEEFLLAWQQLSQWETITTQPVKSHGILRIPSFIQWTPFITAPPISPFFVKKMFLSFVLWTCLWFAIDCWYQNVILCCFQINSCQ